MLAKEISTRFITLLGASTQVLPIRFDFAPGNVHLSRKPFGSVLSSAGLNQNGGGAVFLTRGDDALSSCFPITVPGFSSFSSEG